MNKSKVVFLMLAVLLAAGVWVQLQVTQPVDWTPSFSSSDDNAYGSSVLFNLLPTVFPGSTVTVTRVPAYQIFASALPPGNFIFVTDAFEPDSLETQRIFAAANLGATIFIAAARYGDEWCRRAGITANLAISSAGNSPYTFTSPQFKDEWFQVGSRPSAASFTITDSLNCTVLGSAVAPNFLRLNVGQGQLLLHGDPYIFTNYTVTDSLLSRYAFLCISHIPLGNLRWDEYYKPGIRAESTPLRFLFSKQPLKYAWYLLLASFVLFIFLKGKRQQRVIPVFTPPVNAARAFIRTLAEVYFRADYNRRIRERMVLHCTEYIGRALLIPAAVKGEEFTLAVAQKTGLDYVVVSRFFALLAGGHTTRRAAARELVELHKQICSFYKVAGIDGKK